MNSVKRMSDRDLVDFFRVEYRSDYEQMERNGLTVDANAIRERFSIKSKSFLHRLKVRLKAFIRSLEKISEQIAISRLLSQERHRLSDDQIEYLTERLKNL